MPCKMEAEGVAEPDRAVEVEDRAAEPDRVAGPVKVAV